MVTVVYTVLGAESDNCPRCEALYDELQRVIAEKNYLLQIALHKDTSVLEQEDETRFEAIRPRRIPWTQKRKEVEQKYRVQKETDIKPKLTEAEQIFERELNNAGQVSKAI